MTCGQAAHWPGVRRKQKNAPTDSLESLRGYLAAVYIQPKLRGHHSIAKLPELLGRRQTWGVR